MVSCVNKYSFLIQSNHITFTLICGRTVWRLTERRQQKKNFKHVVYHPFDSGAVVQAMWTLLDVPGHSIVVMETNEIRYNRQLSK